MMAYVNDCLRALIGWSIILLGAICSSLQCVRIRSFKLNQKRLKRRYGITPDTLVLAYGSEVIRTIRAAAMRAGNAANYATTSGSTGKPKELLYTRRRVRGVKLTFSEMFVRACYAFGVKRTSLYVFSSFDRDTSLTSLLLGERRFPAYLPTLQAPYRVQQHQAMGELVAKYGSAATRLWVLAISNPGVLYSTNPSTINTFLDEISRDWLRTSKLLRDWYFDRASFSSDVQKIARRLASRGHTERLKQIATSEGPLPLSVCAPAVQAYICWTGGHVKPFLDRLKKQLPSPRYTLIPMYSMSTETIETLTYFRKRDIAFLPTARGVVYEFMDDAGSLLDIHELDVGKLYAMVVSDGYGLRRYQTDDLFLCERKINGLPDLTFVRRRGLEYSFTGEKLTAEQLSIVFEHLRTMYPAQLGDGFLTCIPTQPEHGLPHYTVLVIGYGREGGNHLLALKCDELLGEINCEYRSKRASGRLGAIQVANVDLKEFVAVNSGWDAQFKLLPLTRLSCPQFDPPVASRV